MVATAPSLNHWLNAGIIAAAMVILISLSDFILNPAQKKRIENFIDALTLRLDYTKTLDWLQRWLKASRRAKIVEVLFGLVTVASTLGVVVLTEWTLWDDSPWWLLVLAGGGAIFLWAWQWQYVAKAYEKVGIPIVNYLADSDDYYSLIGGYAQVIFGGGLVLALCTLAMYALYFVVEHWWVFFRIMFRLGASFVFGMILCWIGIIIDGIVTLLGACLVYVARTVVDAARRLMWRISTYPKGPLTATLTLIGAVLAIIKLVAGK